MKRKLIIFGTGEIAEVAHYYFSNDSCYDVVAFSVDREFLKDPNFCGLPVVPFETLSETYDREEYSVFIALGYSRLNGIRKEKYLAAKALGYPIATYVSSRATVLNDGRIGENCFILEDNTLQPFVTIGNNVTLWSGNHIGHHSILDDHVFLASHVVVSGGVTIGQQCFIGVNATLRDHIRVGERCVIGAGALILDDTEAEGVYIGAVTPRSRVPSHRLRSL
ncbi:acetyltransferase [Pseudomonas massiliensis]|uniref:acetyltransferase n=1 Tax=Pseudomonas massiliensis TaxID=522492 RepID=UPI00058C3718|nr:acetyltransferase [Pseudomonas massiliensis]